MTDLATTSSARPAGISRHRASGPELKRNTTMQRLAMVSQAVAAGARACLRGFLANLHESRRQRAAIVLASYRHLTHDPKTREPKIGEPKIGLSFGMNAATQKTTPAE